jgi:hypothetical protein
VIAHSDVPLPPRGAPSSPTGGVARYGPRRAADTLRLLDPAQIEGLIAIDYVSYVLSEIELLKPPLSGGRAQHHRRPRADLEFRPGVARA